MYAVIYSEAAVFSSLSDSSFEIECQYKHTGAVSEWKFSMPYVMTRAGNRLCF